MTLLNEMRELVRARDNVSFVEFMALDGAQGNHEIYWEDNDNLILWQGVSKEFVEAWQILLNNKEIHMRPASVLSYLCDGGLLKMPIAKGNHKFKKKHWLPVVHRPGPSPFKVQP